MRRWGHRHGVVLRAFVADQANQQGLGCVSGDDDGTVHAAMQETGAGSEAEVAAMIEAAVAAIAVTLKDGLNALRVEGDGAGIRAGLCRDAVWMPERGGYYCDGACSQRECGYVAGERQAEGL